MEQNSACAMRTKRKMADALKELMQTNSFEKITVSDIAELSKIHRQTFYYHFQDRYELLDWMLYQELLVPLLDGLNFDNMYDKLENMFATMKKDKKFYHNALKINSEDLTRYVSRVATEQFTDVVKEVGRKNGIEGIDHDSDIVIAEFFGYGITGVVMSWANRGMKESPEVMTGRIHNLFDACKKVLMNI
ncbi:MAG: TetR/AcrR family transcriptional regulator C-terminal domain-containing protein [Eubacterium sp.]|nr:TetR/AcrR family transcriptional regulator C-terminal domain-containing protein [Eubacterium sp.]